MQDHSATTVLSGPVLQKGANFCPCSDDFVGFACSPAERRTVQVLRPSYCPSLRRQRRSSEQVHRECDVQPRSVAEVKEPRARSSTEGAAAVTEWATNHLHPALREGTKSRFSSTQIPEYSTPEATVSVVSRKDGPQRHSPPSP